MRIAAFEHVHRLGHLHDHLTANRLKPGFIFGASASRFRKFIMPLSMLI